ncbi:serine hydrolase [Streptomyces sp. GbtcB6]|uniref:serine hydrolase domain-containing protein n=1 Tax=Streptomyces sp. GbtcB6 TaxID=2824751 RepID=UPI001C31091D|nr:serine hydrolase domain-containing protein [Streptomyces sp. GbtcB6]
MQQFTDRLGVTRPPERSGFSAERLGRITEFFDRQTELGVVPGWSALVARNGEPVYAAGGGLRDLELGLPVEPGTLWRLYSMTKPVTSVAVMMLVERGLLGLDDPVGAYVPEFTDMTVYDGGSPGSLRVRPAARPVTVGHLLTHTAGLTLGLAHMDPVDALYRQAGQDVLPLPGTTLRQMCADVGGLPLLFEPGTAWNYSLGVDVLGRIIEVCSGETLDRFIEANVLGPLKMTDTTFSLAPERVPDLAEIYSPDPASGRLAVNQELRPTFRRPAEFPSGSGVPGLVSTLADYHRFAAMLVRGGELDGERLLGPRTLAFMTANHLPGGADLNSFAKYPDDEHRGCGFGLGFYVVTDPVRAGSFGNKGEFGWSGAANTHFFVDPVDGVTAVFCTQVVTWGRHRTPIRRQLRNLVYQAMTT